MQALTSVESNAESKILSQ